MLTKCATPKWLAHQITKHYSCLIRKYEIRRFVCVTHLRMFGDMSEKEYWVDTYQRNHGNGFDWFSKSETILENLTQAITERTDVRSQIQVLDLGCGTSELPWKIFCNLHDTPLVLHCLDFVSSAIEFQRKTFSSCDRNICVNRPNPKVVLLVADALQLPYHPNFFDVIIDKGTTDSALRSSKPDRIANCQAIITQTVTCIKPGGVVIQVTDEDPDTRLTLIEEAVSHLNMLPNSISITHIELGTDDTFNYFMYLIKKLNLN